MKKITELKNIHFTQDIWVLCAGASMNYLHPSFFENKIVVGVNAACKFFSCNYTVAKDGNIFKEIVKIMSSDNKLILSKYESGNYHQRLNSAEREHYIFEHSPNMPKCEPDLKCIAFNSDKMVVSHSTVTSALHIAAYMGAKNIILCGHDCGTIDRESTIVGYHDNLPDRHLPDADYVRWLGIIENQTAIVANELNKVYDCNVCSINPFINFNLEGHQYIPSNTSGIIQRKLK